MLSCMLEWQADLLARRMKGVLKAGKTLDLAHIDIAP